MSCRTDEHSTDRDELISELAPGPEGPRDLSHDAWQRERTAGVQRKDFRDITIVFSPRDLHSLLGFLEQRALKAEHYIEVRQAVLFSEMIREQARKQNF